MLDRLQPFVLFEVPDDGALAVAEPIAEPGADPATPDPVDPGAVVSAEPAAEPAAPGPGIDWDDIGVLNTAAERLQALGYQISAAQPEPAPTPEAIPVPDPFADDYAEQMERWYQAKRDADLGPVQGWLAAQQAERIDGQITGLLSSVADEFKLGDVDTSRLRAVADTFAPEAGARFGATPQAAQYAARKAGEWLAAERKTAGDAAVHAYRVSMGEIADTPAEPGVSGSGVRIEPKASTYDEIIAKHASRFDD